MSPVSPAAIAKLRARTGVSILACKEALEEAGGDEEKAIELLRKRGISQAAKKAARDQAEGLVFLDHKDGVAALVCVRCETDFVARDSAFQAVGKALCSALLVKGEAAAKSIADVKIPELVQKLGENISVGEMHRIENGIIGTYLHSNAKIGVIVGLDPSTSSGQVKDLEIKARDAAMHAAAMNPFYVSPDDVPPSIVDKEREIWREQLSKQGKPQNILDKIMLGKEKKFREEVSLLSQPFVKDSSKTVGAYLAPAKVTNYVRVSIS